MGADPKKRSVGVGQVFNDLGTRLTAGELPPGSKLRMEDLEQSYGVSRSVIRDAVTRLSSIGMVTARRSVGVIVNPEERWYAMHPDLVRWRLSGPEGARQINAMVDLRMAVEPVAAALAARRANEIGPALIEHATRMGEAAARGDMPQFLKDDLEFHRMIIRHCGNPLFRHLERALLRVLEVRHNSPLMPGDPQQRSVLLHKLVGTAIEEGDAEVAESAMRQIVHEVRDYISEYELEK